MRSSESSDLARMMAYGQTRGDALRAVEALALRVFADRLEHGEIDTEPVSLSFIAA